MLLEMKVPSPGESISEVEIAEWLVKNGDYVEKDQSIAEIDSDKATLELPAEQSGKITIIVNEGETVAVGDIVCTIDTSIIGESKEIFLKDKESAENKNNDIIKQQTTLKKATPLASAIISDLDISENEVKGTGELGKITKNDVLDAVGVVSESGPRGTSRKKMSSLRRKIASRLVAVKNETAMLTTFNEVDMTKIFEIRKTFKDKFKDKYDVGLGFMSFFTKSVTIALKEFPDVNSMIDKNEIIHHNYSDIGIAVSAPKGLMVPVVRNAELLNFHEIESEIKRLAIKARDGRLTINEMLGGTFTITNGGVFGSMLSTPIINPPQSAILGMHNILERPMAIDGEVKIRPIMYVALSYDHRVIDGRESVGFLVKVKECLENPVELLMDGDAENYLGL
ncbi:2-oxoglutarate dehydrogenase complex dihydrolipoyllysine-residue succinyltransferase [Flavobacteriales bacterium]|jgi:2-oxoglutarate dehydrogenase E2 component (dihydrolipoamide succinyltransferase)|nr:2-oxoglutarate dehydrogenase complex dihydrolipoyllysine-residue succinyltransferase [Flavobacteriales bacterium]MDA7578694.1 2-oxoglutarate dehydrogenase complex dihydrolipoyllysine-residue succinyltransferase [Flavobacteriales bacterium]MDA7596392.1 2-oxoglutarate dehydrogenase complex dihydrolipoyllysine-residue succinyltransferase [Flavobacteriales bacterium]MDC0908768.1 2-oxoglutarate dehydrogenase complex dihydrolipoyllysine-residue succinyltransferase [Flavobacteriales bacterium]MDC33